LLFLLGFGFYPEEDEEKEVHKAQDKYGSSNCLTTENGASLSIADGNDQCEDMTADHGDLFPDF
jgi:hypothetical protein